VSRKRRRVTAWFALFALLMILSLFVLHGTAGGVTSFAAMLVFIGACISALRSYDDETRAGSDRTGVAGWIGGWF
jgi:amino acid permease